MSTLLQNFPEAEKTAYLSAIASLASADRQASPAETEFLEALTQQAGLSAGAAQQVLAAAHDATNESVKQNLDTLRSSDLRYSLITDLISFARADGSYANDEEAMVSKMATYLGISPQQQQTLETVVDQAAQVPHTVDDPAKKGFLDSMNDKLESVGIPKTALLAGLLGVVAPMVLSRMGSSSSAVRSDQGGGMMGGGMLGSVLGGGTLGGLLGGAARSGLGGLLGSVLGGGMSQQGTHTSGGGLGSLMSVLGGLGGVAGSQPRSAGGSGGLFGSGIGGLLGGLMGGR